MTEQMNIDIMENLEGATVQHGPLNRRVYLMKLGEADPEILLPAIDKLVVKHGHTKVFAKVPAAAEQTFVQDGYRVEGRIPQFYHGSEDAVFLGKYPSSSSARATAENQQQLDDIVRLAESKADTPACLKPLFEGGSIRRCEPGDTAAMAEIYKQVFPTYPFPIDDPSYLEKTMHSHVDYYGVEVDGTLVALSSAEMDLHGLNVEMTDFATLPEWRGRGIACHLLKAMEAGMRERGMHTAYTIARAVSPGMNITFAKMGYRFGGQLVNNTNISGSIESMNIWYKTLV
jgi:putative beta-lysine N-acetyltransferase